MRVVITGGPGSGKTSLLNALAKQGLTTVAEINRPLIVTQQTMANPALPWHNTAQFVKLAADLMQLVWQRPPAPLSVYDRGIPDLYAYLYLADFPIPDWLTTLANHCRYHRFVFWCPPWPEIFKQDPERQQSLSDAIQLGLHTREVYLSLGYQVIDIPKISPASRACWLLQQLRQPVPHPV